MTVDVENNNHQSQSVSGANLIKNDIFMESSRGKLSQKVHFLQLQMQYLCLEI